MFLRTFLPRQFILYVVLLSIVLSVTFLIPTQTKVTSALEYEDKIPALLDLSIMKDGHEFYTSLDGEWFYFEEMLLLPTEVYQYILNDYVHIVNIPGSFKEHGGHANTYGTYAVRVKIPKAFVGRTLAINIPFQYSAYKLYADRVEIASNGVVGKSATEHQAELSPQLGYFVPYTDEVLLTIQLSSYEHHRGGFENTIYIGEASAVGQNFNTNIIWMLFLIGSIVIMGIFMILFAWFRKQESIFLIFGLFCIFFAIRSFFADPYYYTLTKLRVPYEWGARLEYIFAEAVVLMVILLISKWFIKLSKPILYSVGTFIMLVMITTLVTKPYFFQQLSHYVLYLSLFVVVYTIYTVCRSFHELGRQDIYNLFGLALVAFGIINDYMLAIGWIHSVNLSLLAVGIYVVIQVFMMSKSYADKVKETEELNHTLTELNATLDEQVNARTKQLKLVNEQLAQQANIDSLTGVYNRHRFNEYINKAFQDAVGHSKPLSIIMVDLDEFKKYNDTYGHLQGDELIKQVVHITGKLLPHDHLYARFGGEEFIVVLPDTPLDDAVKFAESMRCAVEDAKLPHEGRQYEGIATISIGVAALDQHTPFQSEMELIDAADRQLYRAKREGRNRIFAKYM